MFKISDVLHETKQTLESAKYGLGIMFNDDRSRRERRPGNMDMLGERFNLRGF